MGAIGPLENLIRISESIADIATLYLKPVSYVPGFVFVNKRTVDL